LVFPNPSADFVAVQASGLVKETVNLVLCDMEGKTVRNAQIKQGSTSTYFDVQTLYNGVYFLKWNTKEDSQVVKLVIQH
jgi:hypothetical protein